jgi:hypothetical protein
VLASVAGGAGGENWEVHLTQTEICWSMHNAEHDYASCRERSAFDRSTVVGINGMRVVVRLTGLDVTDVYLADSRMNSSTGDGVRVFVGVAPAGPSAKVVGRDASYDIVFSEEVEATTVPDVVGMASADASHMLQRLGFEVSGTGDPSASPVLTQSVAPGTRDLQIGDIVLTFGAIPDEIGTVLGEQDGLAWKVYGRSTSNGPEICSLVQVAEHQSQGGCEPQLGDAPIVRGTEAVRIVFWRLADGIDGVSIEYGLGTVAMRVIEVESLRVAFAVAPRGPATATITPDGGGDPIVVELSAS